MLVNRLLQVSQYGQLSLSSFRGRQMGSQLQLDVGHNHHWWRRLVNTYEVEAGMCNLQVNCVLLSVLKARCSQNGAI